MIYINTYSFEKNKDKYKRNIEDLFKTTVMNEPLDNKDIKLIKEIDNATYVGNNTVCNSLGDATSIENISRGLKTLLVIRWFLKKQKSSLYFDISSCGDNIYDSLVEEVGDTDIHFLLCNYTVRGNKDTNILVNNKHKIRKFSDIASLGGKLYESCN